VDSERLAQPTAASVKVSVLIKAYQHERFIAAAVESAVRQDTDFEYEIVVGEDCSRDRTRDVLLALRDRYPDKLRLLLRERNLGNVRNLTETLCACRGEYVALLDGDDFWTAPRKLQRQAAHLDAHPELSSCAHNAAVVDDSGERVLRNYRPGRRSHVISLRRMLVNDPVPTSSVMFRRALCRQLPDWYYTVPMGDWPLHVLTLRHGGMAYFGEVMGAYRQHAGGLWSSAEPVRARLGRIDVYRHLNAELGLAYDRLIRERMARQYLALADHYRRSGDPARMRSHLREALQVCRWNPRLLVRRSFLRLLPAAVGL
jgi:glycosyltransferase involved in cell wall biosynthesis